MASSNSCKTYIQFAWYATPFFISSDFIFSSMAASSYADLTNVSA